MSPVSLGQLRCRYDGAREEIDESASDVVVYGMVRGRLPVPFCGEHCSPLSLFRPTDGDGVSPRWSMRLNPTNKTSIAAWMPL